MDSQFSEGKFLQRFIPARVVFVFMGFLAFCLVYAYKVVLSMSIIAMTYKTSNKTVSYDCFNSNDSEDDLFPGIKFHWDDHVKHQVLGSFFYGYIITQIPAGVLATKYGGKWIFGLSLLLAAVLSILGPISAKVDYRWFIVTRIGQGLAEGFAFPCMNTLIAQWMPKMERTRGVTLIQTGSMIGTVVTLPMAAVLSKSEFMGSWESTFYLLGIIGLVWFTLWTFLVYESPESHPFISQKEANFILENDGGLKVKDVSNLNYILLMLLMLTGK